MLLLIGFLRHLSRLSFSSLILPLLGRGARRGGEITNDVDVDDGNDLDRRRRGGAAIDAAADLGGSGGLSPPPSSDNRRREGGRRR